MALASADELVLILRAVTGDFESKMSSAGKAVEGMAKKGEVSSSAIGKIGGLVFGALAGAAVAVGAYSVKAASTFDESMLRIQTQAGASRAEVKRMSAAVLDMAGKVGIGPNELAQGLYHVESAGYRGATALSILDLSAKESRISGADLESTTSSLVGVMKSQIAGASSASEAMGTLNAIVGAGNMKFQDLNDAMGSGIASTAATFGVSLRSLGAAMAEMTDQGVPAADAGTRLRMAMALLAAPTAKSSKILTDLGLSAKDAADQSNAMAQLLAKAGVTTMTLADDLRKPNGMVVALTDLKSHMTAAGLSANEQAAAISRAFGGGRMSGPILQLMANLGDTTKKFNDIGHAANNFGNDWKAQQKTFSQHTAELRATLETLAVKIGNRLIPVVEHVVNAFKDFANFLMTHRAAAIAFAAVIGVVMVTAFTAMAIAMWSAMAPAIALFGTIIAGAIGAAFALLPLLIPILLIIAALAILGFAIYELVTHWKTVWRDVSHAAEAAWHEIVAIFKKAIKEIEGIIHDLVAPFEDAFQMISDLFHGRWGKLWDDFKKTIADSIRAVGVELMAVPMMILSIFPGAGKWLLKAGGDILHGLWVGITTGIPAVLLFFVELPVRILGMLAGAAGWLIGIGVDILTGLWNGLMSFLGTVMDFFTSLPAKMINWIGDIGSKFLQIGKDIISGLVNGIEQDASRVIDAIKSIGGGLVGKILGFLGIGSPSRVFIGIGQDVMEGLRLGLVAGGPTVNAQMGIASREMITSFAPPSAPPVAAGPVTNTTNLNLTAMSTSTATEIANEIAWALRAQHAA